MSGKVFIMQSKELGRGDDRLGGLLMANMLRLLSESDEKPASMIFLNTGVYLLCEGSQVLDYIARLEEQGTEMLACTTCLEYFGLSDKLRIGKPTTMFKSIQQMMGSETICL